MNRARLFNVVIADYVWGLGARARKGGAQRVARMVRARGVEDAARRLIPLQSARFLEAMALRIRWEERRGKPGAWRGKKPRPLPELVAAGQRLLRVAHELGVSYRKSPELREVQKLVVSGARLAYHQYLAGAAGGKRVLKALPDEAKQKAALDVAGAAATAVAGGKRVPARAVRRIKEAIGQERFERMVSRRKATKLGLPPKTAQRLARLALWRRH